MPAIVSVNVSQQVASAPILLQRTGCILSEGDTTLAEGVPYFLTQESDFTAIQTAPGTNTGKKVNTFFAQSQTASAFPGSTALVTGGQGVYVLELGTSTPIPNLAAYIAAPVPASNTGSNTPVVFYSYLCPDSFDQVGAFVTLAQGFESPSALTYFFIKTTIPAPSGGWETYAGIKSIFAMIQSPSAPSTEESLAAMFYVTLNYNPSTVNLVAPLEWSFLYGVTPYNLTPTQQTSAQNAGVNYVSTGAAGGISNSVLVGGTFMDGNPFNYWYAIDWLILNEIQALSAAVINGSNTPINPLYYNQAGINTLQKVAQGVANRGVSFGMILAPVVVDAVDFNTYVTENPSDYATGTYNGLSCTFTPARGFAAITVNLVATNIPT